MYRSRNRAKSLPHPALRATVSRGEKGSQDGQAAEQARLYGVGSRGKSIATGSSSVNSKRLAQRVPPGFECIKQRWRLRVSRVNAHAGDERHVVVERKPGHWSGFQ